MSASIEAIGDLPPFEVLASSAETGGEYFRFAATTYPNAGSTEGFPTLSHNRWLLDTPDEHLHIHQKETIEVVHGEFTVVQDGTEHVLSAGESMTLDPGVPHQHFNNSNQPARIVQEHRPALQSEVFGKTLFQAAQNGDASDDGHPNPLQMAVLLNGFPDYIYLSSPPIPVQKALYAALAPLGRLAGYKVPKTGEQAKSV